MTSLLKTLENEQATVALGQQIAQWMVPPLTLYLTGDLGAGKTTFSRGIIQSLGHKGAVKSPTYTLVEPYEFDDMDVFHFDLYRLSDPEELEFMGIRDYFTNNSICLVEWPNNGHGLLPEADIHLHLRYKESQRQVELNALTPAGQAIIDKLK
ncbi:tRNA (adenosine(37)-N6)-threonylcarbamoyltransferase complex ATPase subunit type 1 TsaE [Shewanella algicola]|uniref:tRNA threonylcarbamoyladenosine biosynthesis protein TsaE n=1 Tax=Shewanella algicola TaxID=640633 RepID=A0A9X1Z211_9GAMM|nr:tRNA (adenosine(37)-N6)-threonylcarbamoyltransferase complex ATPase subunit type 1 TsaE [Shewanella algicola]MCL1103776.1 tRNA (adenosine(37)-N6)-threonylcarbamoyltransferase complex ATPase subunit type 1 TsaE [Shewanella algicola]GGP37074.1 tRNA (adenosine(37)-N6)-threonylcarbamoyltransferase complex ATPase subunit type 1 TsaE [Shewanella algicola]